VTHTFLQVKNMQGI